MKRIQSPPLRLRRIGSLLLSALLSLAFLVACTRSAPGPTAVSANPVVVNAGQVSEVALSGSFAPDATVQLVSGLNGIFIDLDASSEPAMLILSAALDIAATEASLQVRIISAGRSRDLLVPVSVRELLVVTGALSREATENAEVLSGASGGIFRQLAADFGSIDAYLEQLTPTTPAAAGSRSSGLSPHLQGFVRVLSGEEGVAGEYVVAIDSDGTVLATGETDSFDGSFRLEVFLAADTVALNPQIALLRGRAADAAELEQGGVPVVCIEPLEVAELEDADSVFTRTRRTRATLLRYIAERIAFQSDQLDPTRRVRTINLGSLTANDQSAKMANFNEALFEASDPGTASPFYDADGSFRSELLACGAQARNELEFDLALGLEESENVFQVNAAGNVIPAGTLSTLATAPRAPSFDAGISFDLPAGTFDFYGPTLSSNGVNEAPELLTSGRLMTAADDNGFNAFQVNLKTPINRSRVALMNTANHQGSLRTLVADEDGEGGDLLLPVGMDACATDVAACDFEGGVTPILDFAELAGTLSLENHAGGIRVTASVNLGRIDIRGRVINSSGRAVSNQVVTAFCNETKLALGRTNSSGVFNVTVMENVALDFQCSVFASSRSGSFFETVTWSQPAPGTLLISNPIVMR